MKTDDEVIEELKSDTLSAVQSGIGIDMMTTGLTGRLNGGVWRPMSPACPRCVVGFHLSGRTIRNPDDPDVHYDLAEEFGRSMEWAKGLMDGTTPGMSAQYWLGEEYIHGHKMGVLLLEWVITELRIWVVIR